MAEGPYKYWAFISYSHRDQAWADWLHRMLEGYRVPQRLVGREGPTGPIPRRLFPVFRDSEELPSSPNLSAVIDEALQQSRYLIVIASPYAAVSRWVDEEIQRFRALGRADRILCLIVDGEPHADTHPDKGLLECFPPALREVGCAEPVGADVRPRKESRVSAKLRLIAGLLGVGLDELRRRERRRRLLQTAAWSVASVLALLAFAGLWQGQQRARQAALAQQALHAHIQTFYEKGRQELQARNEARAAVYLNEAYRLGLDTPALRFMLGRAMRVVDAEQFSINVGAPLAGVAFSPDTKRVLTVDLERHVAIWELASGRKLTAFDLPEHTLPIAGFSDDGRKIRFRVEGRERPRLIVMDAFSGQRLAEIEIAGNAYPAHTQFDPSGQHLAFVQPDGRAAIYDLDAGRVVQTFQSDCVLAGYSRDGRWLITGDALGNTRIYDPNSGRLLRSFDTLGSAIVYTDTSPDGSLLAAGALNGGFRLWEAVNGKTRISAAHASRYIGHVFNAVDGSRLLTASVDSARVWDTRSGALLDSIKFTSNDERIHISEDGRRLINTGSTRLSVIDVDTGVDLFSLDTHFGGATAIDFSIDDRLLATAGRDGVVAFWALPRVPMASFQHGKGPEDPADPDLLAQTISGFSRSGDIGFSGGADGKLELWNSHSLQPVQQLVTAVGKITAAAFSPDDNRLAIGGLGRLQIWNVGSGALDSDIRNSGKVIRVLKFSADGQIVAAALRGDEARLWQLPSGRLLRSLPIDRYQAQAFSPVAARFAVGRDGAVSMWNLERNIPLWSSRLGVATDPVAVLNFNGDGSRLLAVSDTGNIYVLNAADGRLLQQARDETSESVTTAVFSPDGHSVLLSDDNRCAFLLRLTDMNSHRLCGHGLDLASAGFSPDGTLIFTAGRDGTAKVWDTEGNLLDAVGFHSGAITYRTTSFNRSGDRLLTGSVDGSARVWDTSPEMRTAEQVQASLRCRVPWRPDGDEIVPVRPDRANCERR
ncbi:MAG: hypothetical protein JWR16_2816 [Nevskia sp.]|nr:hypothetical protein [Nevskia sp.]